MTLSQNKEYHYFNLFIFAAILFLIFYLKTDLIRIKCPYSEIGIQCKTCGLTSAFRKIINADFSKLNLDYLSLFIAFVSQLLIRPLVSFGLLITANYKRIRNIDITFSVLLFGYCYLQLLVF